MFKKAIRKIKEDLINYYKSIIIFILVWSFISIIFRSTCFTTVVFGIPCPACGMSRAAVLFFLGKFIESFNMHPLFLFVLLGIVIFILTRYFFGCQHIFNKYFISFVIIMFIVYIVRIIIIFPGREPMTYNKNNLINLFIFYFK